MKHLLTIIAAVTLLTACDKEQQTPTCPDVQQPKRVTAGWWIIPTGTAGTEYSYMAYFGDGREWFLTGVAGDTIKLDAIVDDLTSVEYRDTTWVIRYRNYHPVAADTTGTLVTNLPSTRL